MYIDKERKFKFTKQLFKILSMTRMSYHHTLNSHIDFIDFYRSKARVYLFFLKKKRKKKNILLEKNIKKKQQQVIA